MNRPAGWWVQVLMGKTFFNSCVVHASEKKNEGNTFCMDCGTTLCLHCLPSHPTHHCLLQIRRYVYQDVLHLKDAAKMMDCSLIQIFTSSTQEVIIIRQLLHGLPTEDILYSILHYPYLFYSIFCKISYSASTDHHLTTGSSILTTSCSSIRPTNDHCSLVIAPMLKQNKMKSRSFSMEALLPLEFRYAANRRRKTATTAIAPNWLVCKNICELFCRPNWLVCKNICE